MQALAVVPPTNKKTEHRTPVKSRGKELPSNSREGSFDKRKKKRVYQKLNEIPKFNGKNIRKRGQRKLGKRKHQHSGRGPSLLGTDSLKSFQTRENVWTLYIHLDH